MAVSFKVVWHLQHPSLTIPSAIHDQGLLKVLRDNRFDRRKTSELTPRLNVALRKCVELVTFFRSFSSR